MILTDSGFLIALFDSGDERHAVAKELAARQPRQPYASTWPCLTEVMHFARGFGGIVGQRRIWKLIAEGSLRLFDIEAARIPRMEHLMSKYADLPMDLADASLVVLAEATGLRRIFTFDGDFRIYRLADGSVLDVVP